MLSAVSASMAFAPVSMPVGSRVNAQMVALGSKKVDADAEFCFGLPGNIAPAGDFDPANLLEGTSKEEVYRWREAELAHGRVGMLAAAGFLVQEKFHPLFDGIGGPAIDMIPRLPPYLWVFMTIGIGIAETARIQAGWANPYEKMDNVQRLKPGYYPGDLKFDPLGLKPEDPAEFRIMQEKELSHGRLAMLAAAGFMAQESVTDQTWGAQDISLDNLLFGAWFAAEKADYGM